jgi:hypothetical protein
MAAVSVPTVAVTMSTVTVSAMSTVTVAAMMPVVVKVL